MARRNLKYKDYDYDVLEETGRNLQDKYKKYPKENSIRLAEWVRIVMAVLFALLVVVVPERSAGQPLWFSLMCFMSYFAIFYSWQQDVAMAGRRRAAR